MEPDDLVVGELYLIKTTHPTVARASRAVCR